MTGKQPEALFLAELLEQAAGDHTAWDKKTGYASAAELRRLYEANAAFGKRQEWWNDRMFELERQRDELLEALRGYVNDYSSEDGMYTEKHYVKVFSEVIDRAEGKQ